MKVVIVGAGAWGTALGVVLGAKGIPVALFARRKEHAEELARTRENRRYLPGVFLPPYVRPTADPEAAFKDAAFAVIALPSRALPEALLDLPKAPFYVSATKGLWFEKGGLRRPSEVVAEATGNPRVAALSGPNHAEEVGRLLPAAAVVASEDPALSKKVQALFSGPVFRVYTRDDLLGVELAGALKNVVALAAGMVDGLALGDNAKAALLTRGLAEIVRFGEAQGARRETFYGLAGLGDLVATATSRHSRNRWAGEWIVRGESLEGRTVEGLPTTEAVHAWALEKGVDLPIVRAVYRVAFEGADPAHVLTELMGREPREE